MHGDAAFYHRYGYWRTSRPEAVLDAFGCLVSGTAGTADVYGAAGGGGADVGGVVQGAASVVNSITAAVSTGKATEDDPKHAVLTHMRNLEEVMQAMTRIQREIAAVQEKGAKNDKWLANADNKFASGPLKGKYKDPLMAQGRKDETKLLKRNIESAKHTRAGAGDATTAQTGNLDNSRTELRRSWDILVSLEAFRPFLVVAGVMPPWSGTSAMSPEVIKAAWPADPDGKQGRIPYSVRASALNGVLNFYSMGVLPKDYRAPTWVYGLTEAEERQTGGAGPTIEVVDLLQRNKITVAATPTAPAAVSGLPGAR